MLHFFSPGIMAPLTTPEQESALHLTVYRPPSEVYQPLDTPEQEVYRPPSEVYRQPSDLTVYRPPSELQDLPFRRPTSELPDLPCSTTT
ncbi:hypothetical protein TNCV_3449951 [Trichonephila clavipes]|nr:hypothetical protein TNCV_3449951 [Trichonephila clavipes]